MSELAKSPHYRADIQGLRGLAVLLVVLYHAGLPVPGGFIGVDVFFVLSGYVITDGIVRSLEKGKFSFRDFYAKRVRRLLPALTVMLVTILAMTYAMGPIVSHRSSIRTGVASAVFNANHSLLRGPSYFDPSTEYNLFLHTWSLSVEEQFYLLFPVLTFLIFRYSRGNRPRTLLEFVVGIASLISFSLATWLCFSDRFPAGAGQRIAFYLMLTRAWQFGAGALAILIGPRLVRRFVGARYISLLGVGVIISSALWLDKNDVYPGYVALFPTLGAALALIGGSAKTHAGLYSTVFCNRYSVRLGDLSYSWYLWHWPVIVIACACFPKTVLTASIIAAISSLALAWVSERFIESPIRFRPVSRQWRPEVVFIICIALPLAVGGLQGLWLKRLDTSAEDQKNSMFLVLKSSESKYRNIGCDNESHWPHVEQGCRWGSSSTRVLLTGDSNARQLIPMMSALVDAFDGTLYAVTKSACPFVGLNVYRDGVLDEKCGDRNRLNLLGILENKPDVVIIANAADDYIENEKFSFSFLSSDGLAERPREKETTYIQGIGATVKALQYAGIHVILVDPIPKMVRKEGLNWAASYRASKDHALLQRCSVITWAMAPDACNVIRLPDESSWRPMNYGDRLHGGLNVTRVDTRPSLCPEGVCRAFDGNDVIYVNSNHIAPYGSHLLEESFIRAIRSALEIRGGSNIDERSTD